MEKTCGSHAKKCKSTSHPYRGHSLGAGPLWGRQGEWSLYRQFPLHEDGPSGYNEKCENWEDVLVISELSHAQEMKTWADRYEMLDRAYKSKAYKLEQEYEAALLHGFEEAYEAMREMQNSMKEKEARIAELEAKLAQCEKPSHCPDHEHQQVS